MLILPKGDNCPATAMLATPVTYSLAETLFLARCPGYFGYIGPAGARQQNAPEPQPPRAFHALE